jgi:hypothetical protein
MRREISLGLAAFVLAGTVTVDWWLPGPPHLPWSIVVVLSTVALLLVVAPAASIAMALREGATSARDSQAQLWAVVTALPIWVLASVAVVFVGTQTTVVIGLMWLASEDPGVHVDIYWALAGTVACCGAIAAALAYGLQREGRSGLLAVFPRRS